jgi:UDP-N-acetylglucosamine transferase subunit ALG13
MALVLSERDYKLVTLFTKIAGIFLMAAGSIVIVDHHQVWLGLALMVTGVVVALAPVPMTVVRPELPDDEDDGERLTVNE